MQYQDRGSSTDSAQMALSKRLGSGIRKAEWAAKHSSMCRPVACSLGEAEMEEARPEHAVDNLQARQLTMWVPAVAQAKQHSAGGSRPSAGPRWGMSAGIRLVCLILQGRLCQSSAASKIWTISATHTLLGLCCWSCLTVIRSHASETHKSAAKRAGQDVAQSGNDAHLLL